MNCAVDLMNRIKNGVPNMTPKIPARTIINAYPPSAEPVPAKAKGEIKNNRIVTIFFDKDME